MQVTLSLIVADGCNFNCSYCCQENDNKLKLMDLNTVKLALKLADKQITNLENIQALQVDFTGGEPLLAWPAIKETIPLFKNYCIDKGIMLNFEIVTNGSLLDQEKVDFFKKNNTTIVLSLDGNQHIHNKHRHTANGKPTHKLAMSAVPLLGDADMLHVARMTFTPETTNSLAESFFFISELGFDVIKASPDFFSKSWSVDHLEILSKEYYKILSNYPKNGNYSPRFSEFDRWLNPKSGNDKCQMTPNRLMINADGSIITCSSARKTRFIYGNVRAGLNEEKCSELNKLSLSGNSICNKCAINYKCDGFRCTYINYVMNGNWHQPSAFMCQYSRLSYSFYLDNKERNGYFNV